MDKEDKKESVEPIEEGNTGSNAMLKICAFIVDKRNLFFLIFGLLIIFSVVARGWVKVENCVPTCSN